MKKLSVLLFISSLFTINLFLLQSVIAQKNTQSNDKLIKSKHAIPNRYVVVLNEDVVKVNDLLPAVLKDQVVTSVSNNLVSTYGGKINKLYSHALKGYAVEMTSTAAQKLSQDPRVKYIEEDFIVYANDTQTGAPSGLDRIDQRSLPLNGAYYYTTTGAGVNAYILDSGIRSTHNEFSGRLGNGTDFVGDGQNGNDCNGHGTHVAGTVGGTTYGVAKSVTLHNVRVLGCDGTGANSNILQGIDWVTANNIKPAVVNMSLGGSFSSASNAAVANSIAQGITYVIAAGNDNNDACDRSPASTIDAITVGSTTTSDVRSPFSNYGSCVDIFAPGSQITSAGIANDTATATLSGTSMAAPHVTGVVARFLQTNPAASPVVVANSLINSATDGIIADSGAGSPNKLLYADITLNTSPPPPPLPTPTPAVRINEVGPATPYPAQYTVSGRPAVIGSAPNSLEVNINGFSHTYPGEVSFVLEGPTGAKMLIQSDASEDEEANNVSYTISDAGVPMTSSGLQSTIYKPTAFASPDFPAPGPGTAYNNPGPSNGGNATLASTFGGTNPNGVWKLYVVDANPGDRGKIQSWSILTRSPEPPSSPANLRAAVVSNTQINIAWDPAPANQNVIGYSLRINGGSPITGINTTSYSVTGLVPGTFYTFEVSAISTFSESTPSRITATTTGTPVPNPPPNVIASVYSSSQINISWDASALSENIITYNVRMNGSAIFRGIRSRSYLVTNLTPGTTYSFEVQSVNTTGTESAWSPIISATTTAGPPPPPPPAPPALGEINLTVSSNNVPLRGSVTLSYTSKTERPSFDKIGLYLVGSPDSQALIGQNLPAGKSGSLNVSMPEYTGNYEFRYFMVDNPAVAAISDTIVVGNATRLPGSPIDLKANVVSPSQIDVLWGPSNSQDIVSYNLRINRLNVISGLKSLSYPVRNLDPNTTYIFETQAVTSSGNVSAWSIPIAVKTPILLPSAPLGVTTNVVSSSQINVFWNQSPVNENVTSYNLRVDNSRIISGVTYLSYAVKELSQNTVHTFEVQAVNSFGTSGWSTPVSSKTSADVPSLPVISSAAAVSANQINLFWNQSASNENVTSYNLRINGSSVTTGITYLSYAVKNLNPNTTYTFEVQAINSLGASAWSAPISVTTSLTNPPPIVPTNVSPQAVSSSQINVFWGASTSPNIASYNLRVNGTSVISGITYLSYAVKNLNPNTTYTFEVQAVDSSGAVSAWSAPVSATTNPVAVINPPTNVSPQVVSPNQINVFWNASTSQNITSYNLRVNGSTVIPNITYLSYAVKNLNPNTTYTFEVQAVDSSGAVSAWSTPVSATTNPVAVPNAPTNVSPQAVSSSQINVFWNASTSPNITSYNLRVNGASVISGITYLSYAVKNLNPNTTYSFEVQAVDSTGSVSAWSAPVSATTILGVPPSAPTNVSVQTVSLEQINVFWSASTSPNIVSYNLKISGYRIISNITYLSYAVKTLLTPNTSYTFEVQAVDSSGALSAWSTPVVGSTILLTPPTNVSAQKVSSSQINVFWNASPSANVASYNLRINGSIYIYDIRYLSYAVKNLNPDTTYSFEIQTVDSSNYRSNWSVPASATTSTLLPPASVSPQVVSAGQINVFWNASPSPNVAFYNLRVTGPITDGSVIISNITYLSYAEKNLNPNATYTFEVQAVDSSGVTSAWSTPVSATTTALLPPSSVSPQVVSSNQINVFWNASTSPNITLYNLRINGSTVIPNITYLSYAVKNLNPNTTYTFEVQAIDSAGAVSAWSTPISIATPASGTATAESNVFEQIWKVITGYWGDQSQTV